MNNIADIAARLPKISTIDPMHCSDGTINYHLCDGGQTIAVVHEDMFDGVDVRRLAHDLMMAINALPDALRERDAAIARVEAAEADVARWRPRAEFADREVARTVAEVCGTTLTRTIYCAQCASSRDPADALRRAEEAEAEVARLGKALDDAHVRNATDQDEHAAQRAALAAEVERLTRERDEALAMTMQRLPITATASDGTITTGVGERSWRSVAEEAIARAEAAEATLAEWRPRAEFADREVARTVADLRAALAESQAREAALREAAQRLCTLIAAEGGHGYRVHDLERALAALLADPSPAVLRMLAAVEVARAAARWRAADAALDDIDAPPHSLAICQAETDREVAGQALDAALDALDAVQDGDS